MSVIRDDLAKRLRIPTSLKSIQGTNEQFSVGYVIQQDEVCAGPPLADGEPDGLVVFRKVSLARVISTLII